MTFRGFILRLVTVFLITWIVGSIIESFRWGLYYALLPFAFYEVLRPRRGCEADDPDRRSGVCHTGADGNPGEGLNHTTIMPRTLYSPRLSDDVVRSLYREGKRRRMPMTQLADQLLRQALGGDTGEAPASCRVQEGQPDSENQGAC